MTQELNDLARSIATAAEHFVLVAGDRREPVAL
jgi:hypothetical protein